METSDKPQPRKAPRLRLPFEKKASDPGAWSYDHRVGICITLIAYLVTAIVFVSAKISMGGSTAPAGFIIDLQEDDPIQEQQEKEKLMQQLRYDDFSDVNNRISNENATTDQALDPGLKDDRGTQTAELYGDADAAQEAIRANREMYEEALRQEQRMIEAARKGKDKEQVRQDAKVNGRVTVSFSFTDPVRTSERLVIPAYMCEGGGQVVVNATLNNNGEVTDASIDKEQSTPDACMQETAIKAARSSRFNLDRSAPSRHRGTITYIFIPQ